MSSVWWVSLSIVELLTLAYGESEGIVMAPPPTCDTALSPCFRGCPAFLHRHFPWQSPPSNSPICLSAINSCPLPGIVPQSLNSRSTLSRGPVLLSGVCMAAARTVWFSFPLGCHKSAISLSALNTSPLTQRTSLLWGSDPCLSSPTWQGQVQFY